MKNSLHVRVSDKSSLIFQTSTESFNEDYRQIAVVTSGSKGKREGVEGVEA